MDSTIWKINTTNASEFARDLQLTLLSQQADRFQFNADGQPFDSAALYAYGDSISLYKDDVRWFQGVVLSGPRFGSPDMERHDYDAAGLWWYLDQTVFQQAWRAGTGGGTINKSHVELGLDIDGDYLSVGSVIAEVLDHAIGLGAPFVYDAAELALLTAVPPTDEQTDITHSEAIRKLLRWYPDLQTWFDYSLATPVLHFTRRADATALQYDCTDGETAEQIGITRRDDLAVSGVIINYERTDTIDGERIPTLQQDIFPLTTVPGFDVATLTINLLGSQLATQSTEVVVSGALNASQVIKALIKQLRPELADATLSEPDYDVPYPRALLSGTVPPWADLHSASGTITAKASYTDENGTVHVSEEVSVSLVTTDAETRTYTKEISYAAAEAYPAGLAESLFDALNVVAYEGSFLLVEDEITAGPRPGMVLNLTGGLAEWATMAAAVQQVNFNLDDGRTTITFGPPDHLGVQDRISLLNANRSRITHYSGDARSSGSAGGGEDLETGGTTPDSSSSGSPRYSKHVIDDGQETPEKSVEIDSAQVAKGKILVGTSDGKMEISDDVWQA